MSNSIQLSSLPPQHLFRNANPLVTKEILIHCLSYLPTTDIPTIATTSKQWRERINFLAPNMALGTLQEKLIKKGYLTEKVAIPKNANELTALSLIADSVSQKVYEKKSPTLQGPFESWWEFQERILSEMMESFCKELHWAKFPCFERFAALVHAHVCELHFSNFVCIKNARTPIIKKAIECGDMELATRIAENVPETENGRDFKQVCYLHIALKYAKNQDFPKALQLIEKIDTNYRDWHVWNSPSERYSILVELIPLLVKNGYIREVTEFLKKCFMTVRSAGITALLQCDRLEEAFDIACDDNCNLYSDFEQILKYYLKKDRDLLDAFTKSTGYKIDGEPNSEYKIVLLCYLFEGLFPKAFRIIEMVKTSSINQTEFFNDVFAKLSEILSKRADLLDYFNKVPKGPFKDLMCKHLATKKGFDRARQIGLLVENQTLREKTLKEISSS